MPAPRDRIHTVHSWLLKHLVRRVRDSSMRGHMHVTISDAMVAFEQCKCASSFFNISWSLECYFECWEQHPSHELVAYLPLDKPSTHQNPSKS